MATTAQPTMQQDENSVLALVNRGVEFSMKQRFESALACFNQAISFKPDFALAYYNRGIMYKDAGNADLMAADFQRAMQLAPDNAEMLKNIGIFLIAHRLCLPAIAALQRCIELTPESEVAWLRLLDAHYLIGNFETARKLCDHLVKKFPHNSEVLMADALFLPHIAMSRAAIAQSRDVLKQKLSALLQQGLHFSDPLPHVRGSLFYLAYQGLEHREIKEFLAQFYLKSCPSLHYVAPHCRLPRKGAKEKLRVGFVSPTAHQITLNQFFLKLIELLGEYEQFEPVLFSTAPETHPTVADIKKRLQYVELPLDFAKARDAIAHRQPDILIYLEVGSHQLMYLLPFLRLAPVQCALGGFPVTTGIPNMDYFISSNDIEAEGAQAVYSEKLVMLSDVCGAFSRPPLTKPDKTREELGLPAGDVRLYACPVELFKLHPDMDTVFAKILDRDPKARVLLFDSQRTVLQNALQRRFAETLSPQQRQRVLFMPYASRENFLHVLRAVDAVIDTFYFSFGTIAYLSLAAEVPFVTWPGPYFCGRGAYRLLSRMDLPQLIAQTQDDYVEIALKLAQDKEFYRDCAVKMAERGAKFFDDYSIVQEFTECLSRLYLQSQTKE